MAWCVSEWEYGINVQTDECGMSGFWRIWVFKVKVYNDAYMQIFELKRWRRITVTQGTASRKPVQAFGKKIKLISVKN